MISFSPVVYPASPTLSYSSGIPHYTQASANAFTYALGVENASGDMYTQNSFINSDGQTSGFQNQEIRVILISLVAQTHLQEIMV